MEKQFTNEQKKSFKEVCQPVVDWLVENSNPYDKVVITIEEAQLFSEQLFATYPLKGEPK